MWIIGDTALLVLVDIDSEHDGAFNEWYDREHMRDRVVGVPGYRAGRRYAAVEALPAYLAVYQCRPGVLESPAYREIIESPDERTRHFVPLMRNAIRAVTEVKSGFGEGEGSTLGALTFSPSRALEAGLRSFIADALLPELSRSRGIIAGALLESVAESAQNTGVSALKRSGRTLSSLIVLESGHLDALAAAVESSRVVERLAEHGARECALATFRLTYRVSPPDHAR